MRLMNTVDLVFFFSFIFSAGHVFCKVSHPSSPDSFLSNVMLPRLQTHSLLASVIIYSTFVNRALLILIHSFLPAGFCSERFYEMWLFSLYNKLYMENQKPPRQVVTFKNEHWHDRLTEVSDRKEKKCVHQDRLHCKKKKKIIWQDWIHDV